MKKSTIAISTLIALQGNQQTVAAEYFLIRPYTAVSSIEKSMIKKSHAKDFMQSNQGYNGKTIYALPKTLAKISITYAIYKKSNTYVAGQPYIVPYEEPTDSKKEPADGGDNSKVEREVSDLKTEITALKSQIDKLNSASQASAPADTTTKLKMVGKPGAVFRRQHKLQVQPGAPGAALPPAKAPPPPPPPPPPAPVALQLVPDNYDTAHYLDAITHDDVIVNIPVPISVDYLNVPDRDLQFLVNTGNFHGLVTDVPKAEITKNPMGTIAGVNIEMYDRTASIAEDIGVTALNVTKAIGMASASLKPKPLYELVGTIKVQKIVDFDADKVMHNGDKWYYEISTTEEKRALYAMLAELATNQIVHYSMPKLFWSLDTPIVKTSSSQLISGEGYRGIIAREPSCAKVQIVTDNNLFGRDVLYGGESVIAQTGGFSAQAIKRRHFSHVSYNYMLSDYGGLTTLGQTSTSPIKEISGALRNISEALPGAIPSAKGKK